MLSPRYLDGMADEIVDIYAQLEADILQDMARRIAKLGKITEATKWQAAILAETGALKKDVAKIIKKYDPQIQRELKAIYNDALIKSARADNQIFRNALGHGVSDINAQLMLSSIQKTHSDLSRLTITTAYTTEQQFVSVANNAYMQVASGAFDYDRAMKQACDTLAADGITSVQYRNGKPVRLQIEPAVRMNILTGVNQTASAMTMNNCDELGCDLVETTAHIGARPEHEAWQGQIFSLSGKSDKYPPFSICGLGEVDGICGINCRHSYYPYFEGLEEHYTEKELDEIAEQKVTYNGETMTRYEGEEKLRGMERNIRAYKRRALTQEAAGVDNTKARQKIGEWQAKARDFTKQTGIERDRAREFIGTIDGQQPRGIPPTKTVTPEPPKPAKTTPPAATQKTAGGGKVSASNFADAFNSKTNAQSTEELIRYINSKPDADKTVIELFNNMNKSELLKNIDFTIKNTAKGHKVKYGGRELQLYINKLTKNDVNIIGKAGTNLHEIGHVFDRLGGSSLFSQASMQTTQAIKKARKYIKNGGELPEEIKNLFADKIKKSAAIHNKITKAANVKVTALNDLYEKGGMSYAQYYKKYNEIRRAASLEADLLIRDELNGVDALMDIYDALSEGFYQRNGVVSFGHGTSYYYGETTAQASEIWANYTRLSITNPELIKLLRKYEPELVEAFDDVAKSILNNLRGART